MVFFSLTPLAFPLLLWESKPAALRGGRRASCRAARPPPAPLAPAAEPRRSGTYCGERRGSPGETVPERCGKPRQGRGLGRRVESYEVIRVSSGPRLPPALRYTAKFSTELLINLPDSRAHTHTHKKKEAIAEVGLLWGGGAGRGSPRKSPRTRTGRCAQRRGGRGRAHGCAAAAGPVVTRVPGRSDRRVG